MEFWQKDCGKPDGVLIGWKKDVLQDVNIEVIPYKN